MLTSILFTVVVYFLHQHGIVPEWVFYSSIILAVIDLFLKILDN